MRVSQMMVQGLWDTKSPLLQLPHLNQENLRHFTTKKVHHSIDIHFLSLLMIYLHSHTVVVLYFFKLL